MLVKKSSFRIIFNKGSTTNELTLTPDLFKTESLVTVWKIEYEIKYGTNAKNSFSSRTSTLLMVNQLPQSGLCSTTPSNGFVAQTLFSISCTGWTDPDGLVNNFEFYAKQLNTFNDIYLGYDQFGSISLNLPMGAEYDNFNLYLYVKVYDNENGITYYNLPTPVVVAQNKAYISTLLNQFLNNDPFMTFNQQLSEGLAQQTVQNILTLSSYFNSEALGYKNSIEQSSISGFYAMSTFGPQDSMPYSSNFNNLSSVNVSYPGFSSSNISIDVLEANRNEQSMYRDKLAEHINNISLSDIKSARLQASMLAMVTKEAGEISRASGDAIMNQCVRIIIRMNDYYNASESIEDLEQLGTSLLNTVANVLNVFEFRLEIISFLFNNYFFDFVKGLSNSLNERQDALKSDFVNANKLPDYYDTDIENFWTNPSKKKNILLE